MLLVEGQKMTDNAAIVVLADQSNPQILVARARLSPDRLLPRHGCGICRSRSASKDERRPKHIVERNQPLTAETVGSPTADVFAWYQGRKARPRYRLLFRSKSSTLASTMLEKLNITRSKNILKNAVRLLRRLALPVGLL
jgi:hypothetical protein